MKDGNLQSQNPPVLWQDPPDKYRSRGRSQEANLALAALVAVTEDWCELAEMHGLDITEF